MALDKTNTMDFTGLKLDAAELDGKLGETTPAAVKATTLNATGATTLTTMAATGAVTSTVDKTDYVKMLGIKDVLLTTAGTWTTTRIARGDLVLRKTAADDTTVIVIDITESMRTLADKGFKLKSLSIYTRVTVAALTAHTVTLDRTSYLDSAAPTVTNIPVTGTLLTTLDDDPRRNVITVTTPIFNIINDSRYVLEITVNAAATSVYDFVGVTLMYTRNDL